MWMLNGSLEKAVANNRRTGDGRGTLLFLFYYLSLQYEFMCYYEWPYQASVSWTPLVSVNEGYNSNLKFCNNPIIQMFTALFYNSWSILAWFRGNEMNVLFPGGTVAFQLHISLSYGGWLCEWIKWYPKRGDQQVSSLKVLYISTQSVKQVRTLKTISTLCSVIQLTICSFASILFAWQAKRYVYIHAWQFSEAF